MSTPFHIAPGGQRWASARREGASQAPGLVSSLSIIVHLLFGP